MWKGDVCGEIEMVVCEVPYSVCLSVLLGLPEDDS